jgi:hypothetical protein
MPSAPTVIDEYNPTDPDLSTPVAVTAEQAGVVQRAIFKSRLVTSK